jgi:hypothetical protein
MKSTRRGLLILLLFVDPIVVHAQDEFTYTTNADGITLTITGFAESPLVGPVNIPSNIDGLTVVNIGDGAFGSNPPLGGVGFSDNYPTTVTIPGSVTNIGESAFFQCTSLTSATIANGVASIGGNAFSGCTSLISITIPGSVTSIGRYAFSYCSSLASVTMADGVKSIGDCVFAYDTGLTNVTIPASVTTIGVTPFVDCTSLQAIALDAQNVFYISVNGVLFDSNQSTLVEYPGGKVGSYAIPGSVTSLGEYAFFDCTSLTSVTIPDSVTNIGDYAFGFCTSLTNAKISNGITDIPYYGFYWSGLTSIIIPSSVASIGGQAFEYCCNLNSVYFQGNAPTIDGYTFFSDNNASAYYLPGTTGWGPAFGGLPLLPWLLPNPVILNNVSNFGLLNNAFSFTISWATNVSVMVEASTNLANPVWTPLQTLRLTNGSSYFSDPQWTNSPARFYRISSP